MEWYWTEIRLSPIFLFMKPNKHKKPIPTWILVWIFFGLLIAVVALANRTSLENFIIALGWGQTVPSTSSENPQILRPQLTSPSISLNSETIDSTEKLPDSALENEVEQYLPPQSDHSSEINTPPGTSELETTVITAQQTSVDPQAASKLSKAKLFFINVSPEGLIELYPAERQIDLGSSPLTRTIQALLAGPTPEELVRGYMTLIPENTRFLSARVSEKTAFLSFSEEFQFNTLGMEGYISQLRQIIHTATSIPNIEKVQFLIEGTYKESLGSEGIPIGYPLTVKTFSP